MNTNNFQIEIITKYYKYIIKHKYRILIFTFITSLLFLIFSLVVKPKYYASISFIVQNENQSSLGNYANIAAQFGLSGSLGNSNSSYEGDNLLALLKSKKLILSVLFSTNKKSGKKFISEYIENRKIEAGNSIAIFNNISETYFETDTYSTKDRYADSILNKILEKIIDKQLTIEKPDKKNEVVEISFTHNDEVFTIQFIDKILEKASVNYKNYKTQKSQYSLSILQKQTDSVRNILYNKVSSIASSTDLNVNLSRAIPQVESRNKQIDFEVNKVLYGELVKNLELTKLTLRKETPLFEIINYPIAPLKNERFGKLLMCIIGCFVGLLLSVLFYALKLAFKEANTLKTKTDFV